MKTLDVLTGMGVGLGATSGSCHQHRSIDSVPEPATILGTGLFGLGFWLKTRRRSAQKKTT